MSARRRSLAHLAAKSVAVGLLAVACEGAVRTAPVATTEASAAPCAVHRGTGGVSAVIPNTYTQPDVVASVNERITWTNEDEGTHTVTLADNSVDSGPLRAGETFAHTFDASGTYPYVCRYHAAMTGTITICG